MAGKSIGELNGWRAKWLQVVIGIGMPIFLVLFVPFSRYVVNSLAALREHDIAANEQRLAMAADVARIATDSKSHGLAIADLREQREAIKSRIGYVETRANAIEATNAEQWTTMNQINGRVQTAESVLDSHAKEIDRLRAGQGG